MSLKRCTKCEELRDITDFYKNHRFPDGLLSICKMCHNKYPKNTRATINKLKSRVKELEAELNEFHDFGNWEIQHIGDHKRYVFLKPELIKGRR